MKDISEHVRITAAIACGAAIGYRDDWDLTEITGTTFHLFIHYFVFVITS